MSIPLVTLLPQFQGSCWFKCLSPKRRKGLWVLNNRLQQAGEGRTIFLTVIVLRLIYKALKLTKGTDLTLSPQLILTSMMAKDIS
jgi:hypothetical protein